MGVRALSAVDCGYRTVLVSRGLARAALKDDEEELLLLLRAIAGRRLHYFLLSSRTLAAFDGFLYSSFLQELRSWVRTGLVSDSIVDLNFGILGVREREREREMRELWIYVSWISDRLVLGLKNSVQII